jgi:carnitine-CoA ligase
MLLGGRAAIAPRFSASRFWPEIERTGAQVVNLLGAMATIVATRSDENEGAIPYGQIRVVHGAPIPAPIALIWRERFGVDHVGANTFGLTEAFPLTTLPMGEQAPEGSAGRRNEQSFDLQIVDDDDRPMGPNQVGELICRPKHPHAMFEGYWKGPDATADGMTNGWFHTGDLGLFDDAGFFFFKDRKKDYLRRRGENISSQEVEATYLSHPAIAQVAVHAVPSDLSEDDVKVTLVLVAGEHLNPGELFEWSKERVPYFALPRYIEIRSELPLSPVGRVHKFQLRAEGCTPDTWDRETSDATWERR